jgi:hypothetical protein
VNLGVAQSKIDGQSGADPDQALGLFGRIGLTPRLSAQLEVTRLKSDTESAEVRTGTGLLVVDLGSRGALVPIILVGLGIDKAADPYGGSQSGSHIEGGFGLEYRASGGLTIGADVRMGGRSVEQTREVLPLDARQGEIALYYPTTLDEGEYRAARLTLGVRF